MSEHVFLSLHQIALDELAQIVLAVDEAILHARLLPFRKLIESFRPRRRHEDVKVWPLYRSRGKGRVKEGHFGEGWVLLDCHRLVEQSLLHYESVRRALDPKLRPVQIVVVTSQEDRDMGAIDVAGSAVLNAEHLEVGLVVEALRLDEKVLASVVLPDATAILAASLRDGQMVLFLRETLVGKSCKHVQFLVTVIF